MQQTPLTPKKTKKLVYSPVIRLDARSTESKPGEWESHRPQEGIFVSFGMFLVLNLMGL